MLTAAKALYEFGSVQYDLSARTYLMGILNVTPDSFSDGGQFYDPDRAVERGLEMIAEGADFIDVGGESTRPGSEAISLDEELRRVIPVIERLAKMSGIPISIDTFKSDVASRALDAGAVMVNDISGLQFDPALVDVVASKQASVVLMHIKGTPRTMQQDPKYEDVVTEVKSFLRDAVGLAERKGIEQIMIDPGIGFGKTLEHNIQIFHRLKEFSELGYPVLIGPSRKSFIGKILDLPVEERLEGTAAAVAVSIMNGASVIRVHDVKQMKRVARVVDAITRSSP